MWFNFFFDLLRKDGILVYTVLMFMHAFIEVLGVQKPFTIIICKLELLQWFLGVILLSSTIWYGLISLSYGTLDIDVIVGVQFILKLFLTVGGNHWLGVLVCVEYGLAILLTSFKYALSILCLVCELEILIVFVGSLYLFIGSILYSHSPHSP